MSHSRARVFHVDDTVRFDEQPLTNVPLFEEEEFRACLLGFRPGQILPRHHHEHEHEVFDVLSGRGTIWLDGERIRTRPGSVIFVPAGVEHGFENDTDDRWVVRATIYQRTYARHAIQRAVRKRLGLARR